jgi:hypothetical protein
MSRLIRPTLVLASTLLGCADPVSPPGPFLVTVTNAPPASAKPGAVLPEVTLRYADANGTPAANLPVHATGDGTIELSSDVTDGSGRVRVRWSLPLWPQGNSQVAPPGRTGTFIARVELGGRATAVEFTTTATVFKAEQVDAANIGCGVRSNELWCWGRLGSRFMAQDRDWSAAFRMTLPSGVGAAEVRLNDGTICIRDTATNRPWCVDLQQGPTEFHQIAGAPGLIELVDRGSAFCGRAITDRKVWCWTVGSGGFGGAIPVETPAFRLLTGQSTGLYHYSPGGHLCGLTDNGTAWCWGDNEYGELGDGTTIARSLLVQVALPEPLVTLRASRGGACGETADGQVWCWGSHLLGDGVLGPQRVTLPGSGSVVPNYRYLYRIGSTGIDRYFRGQFIPRFPVVDEAIRVVEFTGEVDACGLGASGDVWCSTSITEGVSDNWGESRELHPVHEP